VEIEKSSPLFFVVQDILQFARPNAYNYSGLYRCETNHKQFYFNVTIWWPPVIVAIEVTVDGIETPLYENAVITVRPGQEVIVRCLAEGHPSPRVHWRNKRRSLLGGNTLHIANTTTKHGGLYTCFAKLDIAKDKMQIHLKVLS
jgi:Immunoglobulin domain